MRDNSLQNFDIQTFQSDMLTWYNDNKRDLPWRHTEDPYKIWVSEIMLQQTQVNTVIPYFERFMTKFPTVYYLAQADEQMVLKEWEGLGYYSRARNLHHAAREVVATYDGQVPEDPKQLGSLKGIGPYTQGAILSIAFNKPEPAVDGNVMRVYSRLLKIEEDITKHRVRKSFDDYVRRTIPTHNPRDFNQSIMELGALICTPKEPMCVFCPIQQHCMAFAAGIEHELPIKKKSKKQKTIPYVALLIMNDDGDIIIEQRPDSGLLANMWQFPMVPIEEIGLDHVKHWVYGEYGLDISVKKKSGTLKHVFSHLIWDIAVYQAKTTHTNAPDERLHIVRQEDLDTFPFPVSHLNMMKYLPTRDIL